MNAQHMHSDTLPPEMCPGHTIIFGFNWRAGTSGSNPIANGADRLAGAKPTVYDGQNYCNVPYFMHCFIDGKMETQSKH